PGRPASDAGASMAGGRQAGAKVQVARQATAIITLRSGPVGCAGVARPLVTRVPSADDAGGGTEKLLDAGVIEGFQDAAPQLEVGQRPPGVGSRGTRVVEVETVVVPLPLLTDDLLCKGAQADLVLLEVAVG